MSGISGKKVHSQYQDLGRSNSESRNKKLQECSLTEEHQAMQTKNQGSMKVYVGTCKPKNDIHNKATQNILYSTRHGRGLASVTVNKLDHILNVVWNMEASDFVKFPASYSELQDYSQCVKYPTCLETIGYKLRNNIYETIEQFVHDFRSILLNAKLCNQDYPVNLHLTDNLEKKFNHLLEDHFSFRDFEHITGEQNETKNIPELQYTAFGETSTSS